MTFALRWFWLVVIGLGVGSLPAGAQSLPPMLTNMILKGAMLQSTDGKVTPTSADTVLAINGSTGATEGWGSISDGMYGLIIADKPSSFNGTQMALRLKQGNTIYALKFSATASDAVINFKGSDLILPTPQTIDLVATSLVVSTVSTTPTGPGTGTGTGGSGTGTGGTGGGGTGGGGATTGDVNGDGVVDEADIALLKRGISGETAINKTKMDVNGDGVVNTRDLIELIRTARDKARAAIRK